MKTVVKNILTQEEKAIFVNNYSAKYNLVSCIIIDKKQTSSLLDENHRQKIEKEYDVRNGISKNGDDIAFCYKLDLFSRKKTD